MDTLVKTPTASQRKVFAVLEEMLTASEAFYTIKWVYSLPVTHPFWLRYGSIKDYYGVAGALSHEFNYPDSGRGLQ